jgi:hypothetical protein
MKTLDLNVQIRDPRIEETKEVFYKPLTPGIKVAFVLGLGNHVDKNRCTLIVQPPSTPPSTHNFPEKFNK